MSKTYITIKVWTETRHLLKLIAAITDESLLALMQRLALAEYDKVRATNE